MFIVFLQKKAKLIYFYFREQVGTVEWDKNQKSDSNVNKCETLLVGWASSNFFPVGGEISNRKFICLNYNESIPVH